MKKILAALTLIAIVSCKKQKEVIRFYNNATDTTYIDTNAAIVSVEYTGNIHYTYDGHGFLNPIEWDSTHIISATINYRDSSISFYSQYFTGIFGISDSLHNGNNTYGNHSNWFKLVSDSLICEMGTTVGNTYQKYQFRGNRH